MNLINKLAIGLLSVGFLVTSCDNVLDVDYDDAMLTEDHRLDSPNDTLYSMVGILKHLEKLGERYVLLGELRGDLLEITPNASTDLQEIYNFSVSEGNAYSDVRDYYTIVNHCNYVINNIDTAIVSRGVKVMYKEFAAAKAIRAWTYLQMALNYGSVTYYEQAITTIQDAQKTYPTFTLEELLPRLIADLLPWQDVPLPLGMSIGEDIVNSTRLFFPVRFVLGDLYLYQGNYEAAAQAYYDLMYANEYISDSFYQSYWEVVNGEFVDYWSSWNSIFFLTNSEQITLIAGSTELGEYSKLDSLFLYDYELAPTAVAIDNWDNQTYYHNSATSLSGDMRGSLGSYWDFEIFNNGYSDYANVTGPIVRKHPNMIMSGETSWGVAVYRVGLLYLRYAEAVNRAGKPNLAFAVLKNGLTATTLSNDSIVPPHEKGTVLPSYMDFTPVRFDASLFPNSSEVTIGIHGRGNGNIHLANDFRIPSLPTLQDSILYVEDKIVEELALETAFEGNRFHDLMRVAKRRSNPGYLAAKVAEKYEDRAAIEALLMQESNWYLPVK